jgi:prepilin-type N-terminal cleavage/methylation domain-containing protein
MRSPLRRLRHTAFTLVELLIAVAIMAVLAVVAVPTYYAAETNTVLHVDAQELANVANDAQSIAAGFATTMPTKTMVVQALRDMQPLNAQTTWTGVATSTTQMYPSTAFGMVSYDVTDNTNLAGYAMQTQSGDCVMALTTSGQTVSWIYNYQLQYCDGSVALAGPNQSDPPGTGGGTGSTGGTGDGTTTTTAPTTTTTTTPVATTTTAPTTTTTAAATAGPPLDAPTGVIATPGNAVATVSWTAIPADDDGGTPITGYTVTAVDGSGNSFTCATVVSGGAVPTSCVVAGLTNGTTYTVTVVGENVDGTSPPSVPVTVTPVTMPGTPAAPSAVLAGNTGAAVTWVDLTTTNDGGSPITGYTVTSVQNSTLSCAGAPGATSCTVPGLASSSTYTFTVSATSSVGTGPASAPSNAVTTPGVPGAPTGLAASGADNNEAFTESWTAPANNGGSPITDYNLQYATSPSGPWSTLNTGSTGTSYPLNVGTESTYYVEADATNAIGTGPWSSPDAVSWVATDEAVGDTYGYACTSGGTMLDSANGECSIQTTYSANATTSYAATSFCVGSSLPITPYHPSQCWATENPTTYTCSSGWTQDNGTGSNSFCYSVISNDNTSAKCSANGYNWVNGNTCWHELPPNTTTGQAACTAAYYIWSADPSEGTPAQCYDAEYSSQYEGTTYSCNAGDTLSGTTCTTGIYDTSYVPSSPGYGQAQYGYWVCSGYQQSDVCTVSQITGDSGSDIYYGQYEVVGYYEYWNYGFRG